MSLNDLNVTELSTEEMSVVDGGLLPALVGLAVFLYATEAW